MGEHLRSLNSSGYVARHEVDPTGLSCDVRRIVNGTKPLMKREEWVYLSSQYIAGLPIKRNTTIQYPTPWKHGEHLYRDTVKVRVP